MAIFSIKDNGIGMSDEVKERIFEKFYQGDSSHASRGNGIGLAVANEIMELHSGSLDIDSDEGMGTTVIIQHAGGYTTQYSSLQEAPPVDEGQSVSAGDIIGHVGTTAAAENSMGPHLHFSVSQDGKVIDPAEYVG